jgi:hypothetical protein
MTKEFVRTWRGVPTLGREAVTVDIEMTLVK